jgi:hypothetical protein
MLQLSNFLIFVLLFTLLKSNLANDEDEKNVQEIDENDVKVKLTI